jgi:hypothetical protein
MKSLYYILSVITLSVISSCSQSFKYDSKAIIIEHTNDIPEIKTYPQDSAYINYSLKNDTVYCYYLEENITLTENTLIFYMFRKSTLTDTVFYMFNQKCKFQGSKEYNIENGIAVVNKYYYDVPNSNDEELEIYYTDEFGIILTYNRPWGNIDIFRICEKSNKLIEKLINDKSGFCFRTQPEVLEPPL